MKYIYNKKVINLKGEPLLNIDAQSQIIIFLADFFQNFGNPITMDKKLNIWTHKSQLAFLNISSSPRNKIKRENVIP